LTRLGSTYLLKIELKKAVSTRWFQGALGRQKRFIVYIGMTGGLESAA